MIEVKTCSDDLHSYKSHVHQDLSVGFVQRGSTLLNVNGKDYPIQAGEAIIIYPFVSHICRPVDLKDWAFTMIYIDSEFCKDLFDNKQEPDSIGIIKLKEEEFNKIKTLAEVLKSNMSSFDQDVELTSVLVDLFDTVSIHIKLTHNQDIQNIRAYIESHFLEVLQLSELERMFGMNKFTMIREFKKDFNTTPSAFQLQLKVNHGKTLLKSSSDIIDIALASGFYDQAHFAKEFKKAYGIAPLQYYKSIH